MWSKSLEALWSHIDFKRCYFHHFLSWNLKLIASDHPRLYVKGVNKGTGNLWQSWPPKPRQSQDPVPHCMTHLKYNVFMNFTLISTSKHLNWNQTNQLYSTLTFTCFTFHLEWNVFHLMCVINCSMQWCSCGSVFVWDRGESEMGAMLSKRGLKPRPMFELFNATGNRNTIETGRLWLFFSD